MKSCDNMGRDEVYYSKIEKYLEEITEWKKEGKTESQICARLNITVATFNKYKKRHAELREAIAEGNKRLVEEVESSLYKRALGFQNTVTKIYSKEDNKGITRKQVVQEIQNVLPDVTAIIFTLTNLSNDKWKHKREMELNNSDIKINIKIEDE